MSRIGGIGSFGSDQLRSLNRIRDLGRAISENLQRLESLKRINSAKDDPSGLIQASLLEQELSAATEASQGITRASAILSTADAAAGEVLSQLSAARTLVLEAAGGTLSSGEVAGNQIELDQILAGIDRLAQTSFGGRRLLDGSNSVRTTGVDVTKIRDVDVLDKQVAADVVVSIDVTTAATQATDAYSGGALAGDVTLVVTGSEGTTTISLANGASLDAIAQAFNGVTYLTGITAAVDGGTVDFTSAEYGSDGQVSISATAGTFALDGGAAGVDAVATINGQSITADGSTFRLSTSQLSAVIELDPATGTGAIAPFVVTGQGLDFIVGASTSSRASIALPNLTSAALGGSTGSLSSLGSGRANSLIGGDYATALRIIDEAVTETTRGQAIIGSFRNSTLDSSSRVLSKSIEHMSTALSAIQDTDVAIESALLSNNQLLQQTAYQALSISTLRNQDILDLLRGIAGR